MKLTRLIAAAVLVATVGVPQPAQAAENLTLQYLGSQQIPHMMKFEGTVTGGFSGLDYDPESGTWYVVSDDRWRYNPARFYTADLEIDPADGRFTGVRLTGVHTLRRPDATPYPGYAQPESTDPESIRYDTTRNRLIWSSEGDRADAANPGIALSQGYLRFADPSGRHVGELPQPKNLELTEEERGPRRNFGFEGVSISARNIVGLTEGPRYEDGPQPTATTGAPVRITVWDRSGRRIQAQYAYILEPHTTEDTGASEILSIDNNRFLTLERSWTPTDGYRVRLYEIDLRGATNVLNRNALTETRYRPVSKRLVLNLSSTPVAVENYEAMSWGPTLMSGERTLVIASDDNFSPEEKSQFLLFKLGRQTH